MLILTESQVESCLTIPLALQASSHAFYAHAHHTAITPARIILPVPVDESTSSETNRHTLFKPCKTRSSLGIKVVSVRPDNATQHKPTVPASIMLIDRVSGECICLMGATYLTAVRTAAGSAVATQLFALPDASVLSVFGAGAQAEQHILLMLAVRPSIQRVHIINRTAHRAQTLIQKIQTQYKYTHITFTAEILTHADTLTHDSPAYALLHSIIAASHIICLCTPATEPVLRNDMVSAGTHINAVGSYTPSMQEMEAALVARCQVVMDDENAIHSGDLCIPIQQGLMQPQQIQGVIGEYISHHFAEWPVYAEAPPRNTTITAQHTTHEKIQQAQTQSTQKLLRTKPESDQCCT